MRRPLIPASEYFATSIIRKIWGYDRGLIEHFCLKTIHYS